MYIHEAPAQENNYDDKSITAAYFNAKVNLRVQ
jgi:hypothetical protein